VNHLTSYRSWLWRRLGVLVPSLAATLLVNGWLAFEARSSPWIKATCLSMASILGLLIVYLIAQTLACARLHRHLDRIEARLLRRQLKPYRAFTGASVLLLAALVLVPNVFHRTRASETAAVFLRPPAIKVPTAEPQELALPLPAGVQALALGPGRVLLEPELPPPSLGLALLEPQVISLEDSADELAQAGGGPELAPQDLPAPDPDRDRGMPRYRPDLESLREAEFAKTLRLGVSERPLPEQYDEDEWKSPEFLVMGLFRDSLRSGNIAGLITVIDVPFGRDDSVQVSWIAAILPGGDAVGLERRDPSNWSHVSVEYVRRLAGYHSQATFDLAASAGVCADFLKTLEGMGNMGPNPKISPCVGLDLALWEKGAVGLLLHGGQSIPLPIQGETVMTTDLSGTIRVDLSRGISFRAGYRLIAFRYKRDGDNAIATPGSGVSRDALTENLSGPQIGLDVRF
jgi:hypothetical protein